MKTEVFHTPMRKTNIISPPFPAGQWRHKTDTEQKIWTSISDFPQVQANIVTSIRLVASIKTVVLITEILLALLATTVVGF